MLNMPCKLKTYRISTRQSQSTNKQPWGQLHPIGLQLYRLKSQLLDNLQSGHYHDLFWRFIRPHPQRKNIREKWCRAAYTTNNWHRTTVWTHGKQPRSHGNNRTTQQQHNDNNNTHIYIYIYIYIQRNNMQALSATINASRQGHALKLGTGSPEGSEPYWDPQTSGFKATLITKPNFTKMSSKRVQRNGMTTTGTPSPSTKTTTPCSSESRQSVRAKMNKKKTELEYLQQKAIRWRKESELNSDIKELECQILKNHNLPETDHTARSTRHTLA